MSDAPYTLFDRKTGNFLGEFETYEEAEDAFFDFVRPSPSAAEHLEIWAEDDSAPIPVDPEKIRQVTTA